MPKEPRKQTQAEFAKLLVQAMDTLNVGGGELARATGIDRTTISRYRSDDYESGPPRGMSKRTLERGLGIPEGFLDGGMEVDLVVYRRGRRQQAVHGTPAPYVSPNAEGTVRTMLASVQGQLEALREQVATIRRLTGDNPDGQAGDDFGASGARPTRPTTGPRVTPAAVADVLAEEEHLDQMPARPAARQTHKRRRSGRG